MDEEVFRGASPASRCCIREKFASDMQSCCLKEVFFMFANRDRKWKGVQVLTLSAMLTATGVVIGILCKNFMTFNVYYRFTLENLPVIMAGLLFGPLVGAAVGGSADIISCLCSTNPALNPVITLGAIAVGLCAGIVPQFIIRRRGTGQIVLATALAHIIGQVGIKSIGKVLWFGMPVWGIFIGLGVSFVAGAVECFIIHGVMVRLGYIPASRRAHNDVR